MQGVFQSGLTSGEQNGHQPGQEKVHFQLCLCHIVQLVCLGITMVLYIPTNYVGHPQKCMDPCKDSDLVENRVQGDAPLTTYGEDHS